MHAFLPRMRHHLHARLIGLVRDYYRYVWGMNLGEGVRISFSAKLDKSNPEGIFIGDYTAVVFGATILSHDLATLKTVETRIGSHCLIGARSIVLPGVTIGDHCIIGAGSVVMTNVPSNSLVIGNPARIVERGINTVMYGIRKEAYDQRYEQEMRKAAATADGSLPAT